MEARRRRLSRSLRNSFCSAPSERIPARLLNVKCCQHYLSSFDLDGPRSSPSNHRRKPPEFSGMSSAHSSSGDQALIEPSAAKPEQKRLDSASRNDSQYANSTAQMNSSDSVSHHTYHHSPNYNNGGQLSLSSNHFPHHSSHKNSRSKVAALSLNTWNNHVNGGTAVGRAPGMSGKEQKHFSAEAPAAVPWASGYHTHPSLRLGARHRLPSPAERRQILSTLIKHPLHIFSYRDRKLPFHLRNRHRVASNIQDTLRALSSTRHRWTDRDDVRLDYSASERTRSIAKLPAPKRAVAMGREVLARRLAHGRLPATLDTLRMFHGIQGISLSLRGAQRP
ncbi:hypothetical protein MTO96_025917 [Rhipicephalus appendiculatus]